MSKPEYEDPMKNTEPKQETIIAAYLACQSNDQSAYGIAKDAAALCRIGRSLNRLAEYQCNSPHYGEKHEKRFMRLVSEAEAIAARYGEYGLLCYHQHDPRGACLRIGETERQAENGLACL